MQARSVQVEALSVTHLDLQGLLAQFKANKNDESDSDSSTSGDIRRRSYCREQKLPAVGYATTKGV
jgi:hypothetical protein